VEPSPSLPFSLAPHMTPLSLPPLTPLPFQHPSQPRSPGTPQSPNTPQHAGSPKRSVWRQFLRALPLGNFFCAMALIFLVLMLTYTSVTLAVVARDTRLEGDLVLSNTTEVRVCLHCNTLNTANDQGCGSCSCLDTASNWILKHTLCP
jgi:hypothetical protein